MSTTIGSPLSTTTSDMIFEPYPIISVWTLCVPVGTSLRTKRPSGDVSVPIPVPTMKTCTLGSASPVRVLKT